MILDYLKDHVKNRKELIPTVLLGFSVLCGILILVKVTGFFVASARAESVVKRAIEQSRTDPNNIEKQLASSAAITDELKKNNLFAPPPAKQHPVKEVSGILGDQVLIKNKWYNVGDTVEDAKIVAIGPTSVTIAWDGKEKSFLPIQAKVAEAPKPKGAPSPAKKDEAAKKGPETVKVQVEVGGPGFGGGMGPPGRFMTMSPEERRKFIAETRERDQRDSSGGRGRPGGRR